MQYHMHPVLKSSNPILPELFPFWSLTCLAERSFFEGKLGLEVGVTGALRLPPLKNNRTVFNHLILDRNSNSKRSKELE